MFFPLHVYTGYSFLRSGMTLSSYVALCAKRGQKYCAVSDFETMTGFPELASLCRVNGMSPVYAMDVSAEGITLTLVVASEEGYRNLIALGLACGNAPLEREFLYAHTDGLLPILDMGSPKLLELSEQGFAPFAEFLDGFTRRLGAAYLGLPYLPARGTYVAFLREFVQQYPYPLIAHPHVRYAKPGDAIALSIVEAIANDGTLKDKSLSGDQYFLEEEVLNSYYAEEELAAPEQLIQSIQFKFSQKRGELPHYPTPNGEPSNVVLRRAARLGIERKVPNPSNAYIDRLEYELGVIEKMGYCDYFLIVADYVRYAKTHGISVGPGRGSGAGSLVSFSLGIVTPDPIKYGLLFERFLNPERQSMPDIDVDFADVRRDEVAYYLQEKYGHSRVAHIVTMQTLGAKASIRDVGRVFGYEPRHIDMLAKAIGPNLDSLRRNYLNNARFRTLIDSDPYYLEIVTLASKIEGLPRQAGLHAAGIVLSQKPLEEVVPVTDAQGVGYVVQYEMNHLEEQGCLKMDLLGLSNLTHVDHCLDLIEMRTGKRLDYAKIPFEDQQAIALIASGKTMGLFQLESPGMRRAIATVSPTAFTDVVAVIALFRPGPMENIPSFGRRKRGQERIDYPSSLLEPYLKETYGILVYQEQIMQIVTALAGFSYAQADLFRRAVSKKDAAKLASLRDGFLKGCQSKGVDQPTAEKVFDLIYKFADYGFNKSHAVAYGILACQMAYLKAHYPIEFYCSILDGTSSSDPKFAALTAEMKASGYRFALPSVNDAGLRFLPKEGRVMFPLTAIKGMQGSLAVAIVEEREANGSYLDYFDFALRLKPRGLTVSLLVRLIDAGALDCFGLTRARLRVAAEPALSYAEMFSGASGQEMLLGFDFPKPEIPMVREDRMDDLLQEKECLGMMVSGSPLEGKAEIIAKEGIKRLNDLPASNEGVYAAIVSKSKAIVTKKGSKMAFVSLYDEENLIEVVLFAEAYDRSYPCLKEGTPVKAHIRKNQGRDGYVATLIEYL